MPITIPPETQYSDTELNWIEAEPPGLFPSDQSGLWGQARKVFADYFQREIVDKLAEIYDSLDPAVANEVGIARWEQMLGIPINPTRPLESRRAFVQSRRERGPFTHTRRRKIIEAFITATFGVAPVFGTGGIPLTAGGIPLFSGVNSLADTYHVIEDIPGRSYDVRILDAITVDEDGLTRELDRITPQPIAFTLTPHTWPFHNYVKNPSAEVDASQWAVYHPGGIPTLTRVVVGGAPHGAAVFQLDGTAASDALMMTQNDSARVKGGQRVYLRGSFRRTTANISELVLEGRWLSASGIYIGEVLVDSVVAPVLNQWYTLEGVLVAPANARIGGIGVYAPSVTGAATLQADAFMLYPLAANESVPSTYVND